MFDIIYIRTYRNYGSHVPHDVIARQYSPPPFWKPEIPIVLPEDLATVRKMPLEVPDVIKAHQSHCSSAFVNIHGILTVTTAFHFPIIPLGPGWKSLTPKEFDYYALTFETLAEFEDMPVEVTP